MGGVVRAEIQMIEEIYRLVGNAVTGRRSTSALYDNLPRRLCPHRLGRNSAGDSRVLCYQYGGESSSRLEPSGSPANWRCMKWRSSAGYKSWMISGTPPRTIPARKPAFLMLMWTPRIIRTAFHITGHETDSRQRSASCVVELDIDADDHSGRDPQNGQ